ncbi:hypothetical protein LTS18_008181 [Coniosporium uncinatum]|uniref:Uncharacterized protein n=1 Tax=Coniosporium uncinatum TaxID=93489 RepID=A0ACC3D2A6_9PEZI|nr:hypothetical protein LTS18_008181 [Coniosporium uncinatum]
MDSSRLTAGGVTANQEALRRVSKNNAGSGSDTETDRKGTKLKLRMSPNASPTGSRPGSPAVGVSTNNGSRAGSPGAPGALERKGSTKPAAATGDPPTADDIRNAIPPSGIELKSLLDMFRGRIGNNQQHFIQLVKTNSSYDKSSRRLIPKHQ